MPVSDENPISAEADVLTAGLRALEVLARHAPLDLGAFARLSGLMPTQAEAWIAMFEVHGFAARVPAAMLYVPTPLTLDLVATRHPGVPSAWVH